MKTFEQIQYEVAQWSKSNFGDQQSKAHPDLCLGSLAPLLGIGEEIGELYESSTGWYLGVSEDSTRKDKEEDAVGDITIYLMDYASREGFILGTPCPDLLPEQCDTLLSLVIYTGQLYRTTLKHHQHIRDFADPSFYRSERNSRCSLIMASLSSYCQTELKTPLIEVVNKVWEGVVSKRDWKKNSSTGDAPKDECPHAHPHKYCHTCVVDPCPIGLPQAPKDLPQSPKDT